MLHDRQQLDVREAKSAHVVGEPRRDLSIAERSISLLGNARPRAEVHFIDEHWLMQDVPVALVGAPEHPVVVIPLIGPLGLYDRRGARRLLELEREGIRFHT